MELIAAWLEEHHVTLITLATTIVLLIGGGIVALLVKRGLRDWLRRLEARLGLSYATVLALTRAASIAVWVITAMLVLEVWGVGVSGLWTLMLSAATIIGVGFLATWAMVSNFTASMFITLWRPFRLGDTIEVLPENLKGRVVDRNLMFVVLREPAGTTLRIPNNLFFQKMFRVSDGGDLSPFESLESPPIAAGAERPRPQAAPAPRP